MGDISIGQKFHSLELAKQAINEYIVDRGWSYHTFKSDHKRCWVLICKKAEEHCCNFRIRVTVNKDHEARITICEPHTCPHSVHNSFRLPNSVKIIASNARNLSLVTDDPTAKSRNIASNERIDRGSKIPYLQGHRTLEYLKEHLFGDPAISFQKIPALLRAFEGIHSESGRRTAYTKCEIDPETNRFIRAWVMPIATQKAFYHCRNFNAMDGTHMKDLYKMTILALTTLDGNNQILPLSWAIVPKEDQSNWRWFLQQV